MRSAVLVLCGLLLGGASLSADSALGARIDPVVVIPVGNDSGVVKNGQSLDLYSPGFGLDATADMATGTLFRPFAQFGFQLVPLNGVTGSSLSSERVSLGGSFNFLPVPRLSASLGGGAGLAFTSYNSGASAVGGLAPFWGLQGEVGYRFTPSFSIGALGGYSEILGTKSPVFKGLTAGLRLSLGLDFGAASSGLGFEVVKQSLQFPITYYKGEKSPVATVKITNLDAAEIRDVVVTFSAGEFTSRSTPCANFEVLNHSQSVEVPLLAAFNDRVLGFTETTKLQGQVRIDYKVLDAQRSETKAVTVVFQNRNAAVWSDPQVVGAFISPQDPVMLELSKYVAGLVRVRTIPEIDKGLQFGMGIFEGLRVYGLVWSADASAPYTEVRSDTSKLAYVQYPAQTLSYKTGDSDAIALTVAEALESIAVPAAIAALPEDVIVAFPLDMGEAQARATYSNLKNFIFDAGTVWIPLRASMIRDGFLRAWQGGADLWRAQTVRPKLIKVEEAWKTYTPIPLPAMEFKPAKPAEELVTQAFDKVLSRFATSEVEPKVLRIMAGVYGEPTGAQRNSLGIVYAQYGLYDQAREHFSKAVAAGYAPAVINLANVAFLRKDYIAAAAGFQEALKSSPGNKNVLLSLSRCRYEMGDYAGADEAYRQVRAIDPILADRYSYLSAQVSEAAKSGG